MTSFSGYLHIAVAGAYMDVAQTIIRQKAARGVW
jgi:hypothetical protein